MTIISMPGRRAFRHAYLALLTVLVLVLAACNSGATSAEPVPPTIHYGEDICEFCGMIISDERYAAGYITQNGEERIFDDVGGMFQAHLKNQEEVAAFFVHDYDDVTWIRAETAHFVLSNNLPTPMLFGVVACATGERATALAAEVDGEVLTFDQALAHYRDHSALAGEDHPMEHTHDHQDHHQ